MVVHVSSLMESGQDFNGFSYLRIGLETEHQQRTVELHWLFVKKSRTRQARREVCDYQAGEMDQGRFGVDNNLLFPERFVEAL